MGSDRVLLAVDLSNQAYKAAASHPTLSSESTFTGGLYGFLGALQKAIVAVNATDLVICEDRKPYVRSQLYPAYKELRKTTRDPDLYEKAQQTIAMIKKLLEVTGWPLWAIQGYESDDLISHAAIKYRNRYSQVVAMSNDSDLYQLFKYPGFSIWKGKKGLYTKQNYEREWSGLPLEHLPTALALMGTHNEVEGVHGIGIVTAIGIVSHPYKLRQALEQHADIVERNLELIHLPHKTLPKETAVPDYTKHFVERDLLRFCGRYDINVTRDMCVAFERIGMRHERGITVGRTTRKYLDTAGI